MKMIRECKVLLCNDAVAVIDYNGILIQIPSFKEHNAADVKTVNVKKDGDLFYAVIDKMITESNEEFSDEFDSEGTKVLYNGVTVEDEVTEDDTEENA